MSYQDEQEIAAWLLEPTPRRSGEHGVAGPADWGLGRLRVVDGGPPRGDEFRGAMRLPEEPERLNLRRYLLAASAALTFRALARAEVQALQAAGREETPVLPAGGDEETGAPFELEGLLRSMPGDESEKERQREALRQERARRLGAQTAIVLSLALHEARSWARRSFHVAEGRAK